MCQTWEHAHHAALPGQAVRVLRAGALPCHPCQSGELHQQEPASGVCSVKITLRNQSGCLFSSGCDHTIGAGLSATHGRFTQPAVPSCRVTRLLSGVHHPRQPRTPPRRPRAGVRSTGMQSRGSFPRWTGAEHGEGQATITASVSRENGLRSQTRTTPTLPRSHQG